MAFLHDAALREPEHGGSADVQRDFARVVNAIARLEPVTLVVDPSGVAQAREVCRGHVQLIELPIDNATRVAFAMKHST